MRKGRASAGAAHEHETSNWIPSSTALHACHGAEPNHRGPTDAPPLSSAFFFSFFLHPSFPDRTGVLSCPARLLSDKWCSRSFHLLPLASVGLHCSPSFPHPSLLSVFDMQALFRSQLPRVLACNLPPRIRRLFRPIAPQNLKRGNPTCMQYCTQNTDPSQHPHDPRVQLAALPAQLPP